MPIGSRLQSDAKIEQRQFAARSPDDLKADRHSAPVEAGRYGERRQAQIIDEPGEAAERIENAGTKPRRIDSSLSRTVYKMHPANGLRHRDARERLFVFSFPTKRVMP